MAHFLLRNSSRVATAIAVRSRCLSNLLGVAPQRPKSIGNCSTLQTLTSSSPQSARKTMPHLNERAMSTPSTSSSSRVIPGNCGMDHVGLVVSSVSEVSAFLIDVFGCRFDWEVKRDATPTAGERFIEHRRGAQSWSDLFGVHHDAAMRHVMMLKCGDHHLAQYIELFEWESPDQRREWPKFSDIGHAYVSFTLQDVAAVIAHIERLAIPGVRAIQDPPMQFEMRDEVCSSTFITTPWGLWIELCEWSESKKDAKVMKPGPPAATSSHVVDAAGGGDNHAGAVGHPDVGRSIFEVETPCWFVDLDRVDANAKLMAQRMRAAGVNWRPPVKAHRCPQLARSLIKHGADGVLVLTLDEAQLFADWGFTDIHLANQVFGAKKIAHLIEVAERISKSTPDDPQGRSVMRVNVDDADNAREIHEAARAAGVVVEALVEINVNHNRAGVSPDQAPDLVRTCVELQASQVDAGKQGGIQYVGLQGYEGHTPILPKDEKTAATEESHAILAKAKALVEEAGFDVPHVCGGGSCNYMDCLDGGVLTEVQAGGGALCDRLYKGSGGLGDHGHDYGVMVLTEITSVPKDGSRAIGDAGFKQVGWHPFGGPAQPRDRDDIEVTGLSAEHCRIFPKKGVGTVNLKRGDKIALVPGYTDAMGYGWSQLYATRDDTVVGVWATGPRK